MKYTLPKDYLSYSQMQLWQQNKDAYRSRYYENGASFENLETIFGKKIASMLEHGDADPVLDKLPRYKSMEHRIQLKVKGVPFLGVMDSFSVRLKKIIEYKTGKTPWDDVRVAKHDQLVVYSLLAKLKYKKVHPCVRLVWMETRFKSVIDTVGSRQMEGEGRELEMTGKVKVFERRIAEWERKRMAEKIARIAKEISDDYKVYLSRKVNE